jgi:hypothetical protein
MTKAQNAGVSSLAEIPSMARVQGSRTSRVAMTAALCSLCVLSTATANHFHDIAYRELT